MIALLDEHEQRHVARRVLRAQRGAQPQAVALAQEQADDDELELAFGRAGHRLPGRRDDLDGMAIDRQRVEMRSAPGPLSSTTKTFAWSAFSSAGSLAPLIPNWAPVDWRRRHSSDSILSRTSERIRA